MESAQGHLCMSHIHDVIAAAFDATLLLQMVASASDPLCLHPCRGGHNCF
jgi:hypothetical protein